jgi:hypothetical protein
MLKTGLAIQTKRFLMPPDEETVVEEGITTSETEALSPQQDTLTQEESIAPEALNIESVQDRNWRQMRERIEELQQSNNRLTEAVGRSSAPPKQEVNLPDWDNVDDEDLLTKKQTMGVAEKVAAEAVRKALQQREYEQAPKLIESEMQDYSQVVTPENVERLKQTNPRLAASLGDVKDPYAQGALAYSYIKSQGIYKENADVNNRQRALANSKKPLPVTEAKPSNALESANAYANGLTPEVKQKLFAEMQAAIRKG